MLLGCRPLDVQRKPVTRPQAIRWLARGVVKGDDGVERVPAELEGGPVAAAVAAFPELAIGETSEQAAPLVTSVYPLSSVAEAFEMASRKDEGFGKAVVEPGS
jgi:hypothetical protein